MSSNVSLVGKKIVDGYQGAVHLTTGVVRIAKGASEGLDKTDLIASAVLAVLFGYLLGVGFGLTIGVGAFVIEKGYQRVQRPKPAPLAHPIILPAANPPASSAAPQKSSKTNKKPIFSSKRSSIVGAMGIPNNGDNCFLAAIFHTDFNDPVLGVALQQVPSLREFGAFYRIYDEERLQGERVCSAEIGECRETLVRLSGDPRFLSGQHDAWEARRIVMADKELVRLLEAFGYYTPLITRRYWETNGREPLDTEAEYDAGRKLYYTENRTLNDGEIPIDLQGPFKKTDLLSLLLGELESDSGATLNIPMKPNGANVECKELSSERKWEGAPSRLRINLKRWSDDPAAPQKLKLAVTVPEKMVLPGRCFVDGQERTYRLKSVLEHIGKQASSGHYVAWNREGSRFYLLNDDDRTEKSLQETLVNASKAYRYVYELVD